MFIIYQVPHQSTAIATTAIDTSDFFGKFAYEVEAFEQKEDGYEVTHDNLTLELAQEIAGHDMNIAYAFDSIESANAALEKPNYFTAHALTGIEALKKELAFLND